MNRPIGTGQLFIGDTPIGVIDSFKAPALPMPPTPGDLVEYCLAKNFEFRFNLEAAAMNILASLARRMTLESARRSMSKRGFRRWRAKHWRKGWL